MRKTTILLLAFIASTLFATAQNAYNDAIALSKMVSPASKKFYGDDETLNKVAPILHSYLSDTKKATIKTYADIRTYYLKDSTTKNPFIADHITLAGSYGDTFTPTSNLLSSIGNLNVTTIADGFAKFIVQRTKQELQDAFFDRFIKEIEQEKFKDIWTLFPATYNVVKALPQQVYTYKPYLQSLREAFGNDMDNLMPHLETVLRNGKYAEFFDDHKELKSTIITALYFGNGLKNGKHIGQLIQEYNPTDPAYDFTDSSVDFARKNALLFTKEVSLSLRKANTSDSEYYVPADSIRMLVEKDPIAFNIYLGLLYEKTKSIQIVKNNPLTYGAAMAQLKTDIDKLKGFINTISTQVEMLQASLANIKGKPIKDITIENYSSIFNNATGVLNAFRDNALITDVVENRLPDNAKLAINTFWNKYDAIVQAANNVLNLFTNIKQKQYSLAMVNVKNLYAMRYPPAQARGGDTNMSKVQEVINFIIEKGAFISSVAEAKNSDEVYAAINQAALPPGSSRIKRLSKFNVALNAYCGLYIGNEVIKGADANKPFSRANSFGLTAPVGISISKGLKGISPIGKPCEPNGGYKNNWSHSLFLSIVDLGTVAAYRFQDDTTAQVPTIQLKHIFSPGIFYSLGLPNWPISINLGAQMGPNLRKVTSTVNDYSDKTYIRYSASICVDLPLMNFYTRPSK